MHSILKVFLAFLVWDSGIAVAQAQTGLPETNSQINIGIRSDLWTSIYQNKDTPVRIYEANLKSRWLDFKNWQADFIAGIEGFSSGRADLVVGPQRNLVGSDLRDQKAGLQLNHRDPDESGFAISALYESASDQPFQNRRDDWTELEIIYQWSQVENHQYFLKATDSKNRGYLNGRALLIPGLRFEADEAWHYSLSLDSVQITWQKDPARQFQLTLDPVRPRLQFQNQLAEKRLYEAALGLRTRSYLYVNRVEDDSRVFIEETYVENSFYFKVSPRTSLKFCGGLSFNRNLYEGKEIYRAIGHRSTMPSDTYGSLRGEFLF
jgi:hypothetical protein